MKKHLLACALTLSISSTANAEGWLDSVKSFVGLGESTEQVETSAAKEVEEASSSLDILGLVGSVTDGLGVNKEQAEGGVASLFNLAKSSLGDTDYTALASSIPGVDGLLSKVPDVSGASSGGVGGLLSKASEYSDSLKTINTVKQQFEALGLKPEMITQYISKIQGYLDTDQGQQAKALFTKAVSSFAQ